MEDGGFTIAGVPFFQGDFATPKRGIHIFQHDVKHSKAS